MQGFKQYWNENFGNEAPFSHNFKWLYEDNWVRFHALPNSKQYPDNKHEYDVVLQRAKQLANLVIGDNSECWAVSNFPKSERVDEDMKLEDTIIFKQKLAESFEFIDKYETPEEQTIWVAYAKRSIWSYSKFKPHLVEIADEIWPKLFWVSTKTHNIFAPYDGGFDVISPSREFLATLRNQFSDWLPDRPDGL